MTVDVTGVEHLVKILKDMERQTRRISAKAVKRGTDKLRDAIKEAAPVDKGDIKKSVKSRIKTYDQGLTASGAVVIETAGSHWIPVEFGHSNGLGGKPVPPHPFVYPTRDRLLPGILDEIERDVDSIIDATTGE